MKKVSYLFPKDFVWGVATSAAQIEGASREDGKGESIWDRYAADYAKDAPAIACDHYHRFQEDIRLIKRLGIPHYRLSVAWPRIFPHGRGAINPKGLDFYDRLIDTILQNRITPWVTLFHWDLPQALENEGGWRARSTAEAFANYAELVVQRLGDRVKNWISLNEMACFIGLGYGAGTHAPAVKEHPHVVNQAYHNALLAHGYAVRAVREHGGKNARIGLVHLLASPLPVTETEADIAAVRADYAARNGQLMGPVFQGAYPRTFLRAAGANAPKVAKGDMELISQRTDFFGINIYSGHFVRADKRGKPEVVLMPKQYPVGDLPWMHVASQAIYWVTRLAREIYGVKTVYITENGATFADEVLPNGEVQDLHRREYLRSYLISLHRAIQEGFDVRGYFLWSFMDNYEWAEGYAKRFGIVHVDYATQKRTPKLSADWYSKVIRHNRVI